MTIEDLGNIGEFIGAIGVVLTLVYLAFQIRQQSRQMQMQNIRSQVIEEHGNMSLQTSPHMAAALRKAYGEDTPLDFGEKMMVEGYVVSQLASIHADFQLYKAGFQNESVWKKQRLSCQTVLSAKWVRQYWEIIGIHGYPKEFVDEVNEALSTADEDTHHYWAFMDR